VRDATAFGNRCPQTDGSGVPLGNEDCLTLNIYAINPPASTKQPVMVFIHGGAERVGSAQDVPWNLVPPLEGHGVIVVTTHYRLGLLGFLAHPLLTAEAQGSSGNYGLMDLVASLKWVHDNIAKFGGDPAKVMIFGESAGSQNVQALLASPAAAGLFSAAAMESRVLRGRSDRQQRRRRLSLVRRAGESRELRRRRRCAGLPANGVGGHAGANEPQQHRHRVGQHRTQRPA